VPLAIRVHPYLHGFALTSVALSLFYMASLSAQTIPPAVIESGANLDYEQYYKGSLISNGVIQGSVTIHPVPPYPSQLGGAGISVFDGASVTINPNLGTPGAVRVTSEYQSGAPNDALYIANGSVEIVASPAGVWFYGLGESVHALYMPQSSAGASSLNAANTTFTTNGLTADGIRMHGSNSTVGLLNSSILVQANDSWGLQSWGGSKATLTEVNITSSATSGTGGGVRVFNGSEATLLGSALVSSATIGVLAESGGVLNINSDASVAGTLRVHTSGASGSHAVRIATSTGNLNRAALSTVGNASYGLYVSGTSNVTGSAIAVSTQGTSSYGMWLSGSSTVSLNGGSITTQGGTAYGLLVGSGATIANLSDFSITTHGTQAYGIYASTGSTTNFAGGRIATDQASTYGIYANAGVVNLLRTAGGAGTAITTTGTNAYAVRIQNGGELYATGATLHAQGSSAAGIVFDAPAVLAAPMVGTPTPALPSLPAVNPLVDSTTPPPLPAIVTTSPSEPTDQPADAALPLSGAVGTPGTPLAPARYNMRLADSTVTSDRSVALWAYGGVANVALERSTLTGATASLYATSRALSGGGTLGASLLVDADQSVLNGRIYTDAQSTTTLNLKNGSRWLVTTDSNLTHLSNSSSLIDFPLNAALLANPTDASVYRSVRVDGTYVGDSGTVALNTWLAGDGSPSDRLILDGGSATGTTRILVRNTGGAGALTGNTGILVVDAQNGSTTAANAFSLARPLRPGAYNYRLFQAAMDGSNPDNWYLRSEFVAPPEPPDPTEPPTTLPIVGPELSTYGIAHPHARQMGLAALGTFHERVGESLTGPSLEGESGQRTRSAWGRLYGQDSESRYRAYVTPRSDARILGAQVGLDLWQRGQLGAHRDTAGVSVAYTHGRAEAMGLVTNAGATAYEMVRTGRVSLDAYSVGAYWTHYGPDGWYLDGVLQATRYSGTSRSYDTALDTKGHGWVASLEGGYPIALPWGPGFVLEPQVQLIWQRVSLDTARDEFGYVALGSSSGTTARLGARAQWTLRQDNGDVWQPYVRANLWRDMGGESTPVYGGVDRIPLSMQATRLELAAGLTAKLSNAVSLYAQLGYQKGLHSGDQYRRGVNGNAGIRYRW